MLGTVEGKHGLNQAHIRIPTVAIPYQSINAQTIVWLSEGHVNWPIIAGRLHHHAVLSIRLSMSPLVTGARASMMVTESGGLKVWQFLQCEVSVYKTNLLINILSYYNVYRFSGCLWYWCFFYSSGVLTIWKYKWLFRNVSTYILSINYETYSFLRYTTVAMIYHSNLVYNIVYRNFKAIFWKIKYILNLFNCSLCIGISCQILKNLQNTLFSRSDMSVYPWFNQYFDETLHCYFTIPTLF